MAKRQMVINYVAGEECRVAVIEDGKLEEFHSERADSASHVGSIYLGTVVNVEPAIQAAFVDFGLEQSGFLHVSDLHPRYFPGEDDETTERVGKKTPRRERPPIQQCLRRGQEIAVQVLKEGVGTKGPTLTSYLSIPGRFLVMMPQMDKVGVSRKVEDEETRRQMREILDQLDLPDGFGFILRTAGLERTKLEIKRDLAYLLRLWKDIEKRWKKGARPRLLYSESDLLVRSLRDMLSTDIDRIVIDNEGALKRAARFLKIVAPRSAANLVQYTGKTPLFHAMGVEPQIRNIHAREVPLPSGGRLVIDETEALVAIDVNSGKSREARDAETNAYETNMEAADEICRQLRLRDLGGIVVNDLIDMRSAKHRRDVENRFKDLLKKDRARSTVAPISPFGILEMTRQRMRGSQESMHFAGCPTCRGRGLVQKPDSVADDATRELATLLEYPRVARVQMVVAPRLAGELLSTKRHTLSRLERVSGKRVEVRVSEAVPVDRVSFYAYDDRGADIDTAKLPAPKLDDKQLTFWEQPAADAAEDWAVDPDQEAAGVLAEELTEPVPVSPEPDMLGDEEFDDIEGGYTPTATPGGGGKKKRRRRRRRGGKGEDGHGEEARQDGARQEPGRQDQGRRDGGGRQEPAQRAAPAARPAAEVGAPRENGAEAPGADGKTGEGGRRRRRRRRGRGGGRDGEAQQAPGAAAAGTEEGHSVLRRVGGEGEHAAGDRSAAERAVEQRRGGIVYGNYDDDEVEGAAGGAGEPAATAPVSDTEEAEPDEAAATIEAGAPVVEEPDAEEIVEAGTASSGAVGENGVAPEGGPKRRRRRRGRGGRDRGGAERAEGGQPAEGTQPYMEPVEPAPQKPAPPKQAPQKQAPPKPAPQKPAAAKPAPVAEAGEGEGGAGEHEESAAAPKRGRRRGRGGRGRGSGGSGGGGQPEGTGGGGAGGAPAGGKSPGAKAGGAGSSGGPGAGQPASGAPASGSAKPQPRTLYAFRRKLSASELARVKRDS